MDFQVPAELPALMGTTISKWALHGSKRWAFEIATAGTAELPVTGRRYLAQFTRATASWTRGTSARGRMEKRRVNGTKNGIGPNHQCSSCGLMSRHKSSPQILEDLDPVGDITDQAPTKSKQQWFALLGMPRAFLLVGSGVWCFVMLT